ncbi:MAG TPA: hypothetical protein VKY19_25845 [Ktedonosporobacter sp.]|jgi:hypothetical protein|nr:hypothetical protein [Ktedonosporobacter sp.]
MSTTIPRLSTPYNRNARNQGARSRNALQSYILLALGVICLLGALFLRLDSRAYPIGLFLFGFGLLIAALVSPRHLIISGVFFTCVGAAFFLGFRKIVPFDNSLLIMAISLALLGIALMARKGYVGAGALTPGLFVLLVGIIQYPVWKLGPRLAPFVLSLWFPGIALLVIGLAYWFLRNRTA